MISDASLVLYNKSVRFSAILPDCVAEHLVRRIRVWLLVTVARGKTICMVVTFLQNLYVTLTIFSSEAPQ